MFKIPTQILSKRKTPLIGVLVLVLVSLGFIFVLPIFTRENQELLEKGMASGEPQVKIASTSVVLASPTPIPTPSPATPSAASEVHSGYCLNVPVIFYHHIQPLGEANAQGHGSLTVDSGTFGAQMAYLVSRGYNTISADQLVAALAGHGRLPAKSIVVSIDDGYDDIFKYAYPIIQKYGITVSLAIPTGLMNNPGYMNWDQLSQMTGSGKVFVYNHTWSHANLVGAIKDKVQYEVSTAKKQLSENLGRNSSALFYPYGATNNMVIGVLAQNGYNAGFTTIPGITQCDSFIMSLHRTRIGNAPLASYGL